MSKGVIDAKSVELIRMAFNENPYGTSPMAITSILDSINLISQYPPLDHPDLKDKIAEHTTVKPNNISVAAGSVSFIDLLLKNFVKGGENIIIPKISFIAYKILAERYKVHTKTAEMKNYGIDLNVISELVDSQTRLIFLANPNNPTGTVFTHDEIYNFLKNIDENVFVIIDEAYVEYVKNKNYPRSLEFLSEFKNVIILRSFSKAYGLAGLRIGYAISNPNVIDKLENFIIPYSVTGLSSMAAISALEDRQFLEFSVEKNDQERAFLFTNLKSMGFNVVPSEGNFLFIHFDGAIERDEVFEKMIENLITTKKTDLFGDEKSIRITIGNHTDNEKLIFALR